MVVAIAGTAAGRLRRGTLRNHDGPARSARLWLQALQKCVRAVDYTAARKLFAADAYAFGTRAAIVRGRGALERGQWRRVWPRIRDFTFRLAEMHCVGSETDLCVIVPWDSRGVNADGSTFARPGRATIFLTHRGGRWVALHSHFSLAPASRRPEAIRRSSNPKQGGNR